MKEKEDDLFYDWIPDLVGDDKTGLAPDSKN